MSLMISESLRGGPFYFGRGVGQLPKNNSYTAKVEKKKNRETDLQSEFTHSLTHKQKVKKSSSETLPPK